MVAASLGFAMILFGVVVVIWSIWSPANDKGLQAPAIAVPADFVVDATAGLFFVQATRTRRLMDAFFDRLRIDRRVDRQYTRPSTWLGKSGVFI